MKKFPILKLAGLILALVANAQPVFANCDKGTLNTTIYKAQTLAEDSRNYITELLNCPEVSIREQAVFWGAFYFAMTEKEGETLGIIEKAFSSPKSSSEKDQLYFKARRGNWAPLKKKIDSGDPAYLDDLNGRIILAHSLFYNHKYQEGLKVFRNYLAFKSNDDLVDAEYLFALIWAKDIELAHARIARLKSFPLGSYLRKSASHAEDLLLERRLHSDKDAPITFLQGPINASMKMIDTYLGQRRSLEVSYQDEIGASVTAHQIDSELESKIQNLVEFNANYQKQFPNFFTDLSFGLLSGEDAELMGHADIGKKIDDYTVRIGISRTPLTLEAIQPNFNQAVSTDSLYIDFKYSHWFEYFGGMAQDDRLSPYEVHKFLFKAPIFYNASRKGLYVLAPINYRRHPKPSPFYESRPSDLTVQGGVKYDYTISHVTNLMAKALIGSRYRNTSLDTGSYESSIVLEGDVAITTKLRPNLEGILRASVRDTSKEEFTDSSRVESYMEAGLRFIAPSF